MIDLLAVAIGGSIGAVARHLVGVAVARWINMGFPLATLVVNLLGSLLMGILAGVIALRWQLSEPLRLLLATGLLGAFTTFSTFSLDIWMLVERQRLGLALLYVVLSLVLGVLALLGGLWLARRLMG